MYNLLTPRTTNSSSKIIEIPGGMANNVKILEAQNNVRNKREGLAVERQEMKERKERERKDAREKNEKDGDGKDKDKDGKDGEKSKDGEGKAKERKEGTP